MKKPFSIEARSYIAEKLREADYDGLANEVYWWSDGMKSFHKKHNRGLWRAMTRGLKEMPLLINCSDQCLRIIAIARLHLGK